MARRKHVDLTAATPATLGVNAGAGSQFDKVVLTKHGADTVWYTVAVGKTDPADPADPVAKADDVRVLVGGVGAYVEVDIPNARYVRVRAVSATAQTVSLEGE